MNRYSENRLESSFLSSIGFCINSNNIKLISIANVNAEKSLILKHSNIVNIRTNITIYILLKPQLKSF